MRKWMVLALAFGLGACSGQTVTGPDPVEQTTVAPTPDPTPTPTPAPAPAGGHNAKVKGGFYSITNETGIRQFYCAAAFGVLPGGEQGAGTNLFEDQGQREPKDVFSGQAPKTAACQYKQIQVDLTQATDCRNFTWTNVLAAEVYANPDFIEGSEATTLEPVTTYEGEGCSKQKVVTVSKKFKCSGQVVVVSVTKTPAPDPVYTTKEETTYTGECSSRKKVVTTYRKNTCEQEAAWVVFGEPVITASPVECCKYPTPSSTVSNLTYPTYTPAVPAVKAGGYQFGNDSNGNVNACVDNGGVWYQAPLKFCKIAKHFGNTWDDDENLPGKDEPQSDGTWFDAFTITPAVPASGGNPISGSATVSGAGVWKLILRATDPGNYEKNVKSVTLTCNSQPSTLTVSYNWIGHDSEKWKLELYRDNVLVSSSWVVYNPSN